MVYYPTFPTNALTTNGDLTISGDPPIKGTCGHVHANDDLILNSPLSDIDGTNTGSDDLVVSGIPQGGTGNDIPVPFLDPTDYREHADFILTADGKVFEKGNPTAIHDRAFDGDSWTTGGWKWTSASPPHPINGSMRVIHFITVRFMLMGMHKYRIALVRQTPLTRGRQAFILPATLT